jgi:sulfite reductase alpha subunit-like flavoprotein
MIAHGTGFSPFLSISERIKNLFRAQSYDTTKKLGNIFIFYGVRNDDDEFYF